MKINQAIDLLKPDALKPGTPQASGLKSNKAEPASAKTSPEVSGGTTPAAGGASLNISPLSTRLQTLESKLADGDSFDASRVSEIKQSIRDGSFKVNAEAVADKLLTGARDLFIKPH
jgi:negative regulator of flagellin synthesis FlgM